MKNLFYVCLIAMLSLGSTGFTTVEETVIQNDDDNFMCAQGAGAVWERVAEETNDADEAQLQANIYYNMCVGLGFFDFD